MSARLSLVVSAYVAVASVAYSQTITIFSYPDVGVYANIAGLVSGIDPSTVEVAIVDDVFDTFWSKPYESQPYVLVANNGDFNANFITGGNDACAKKIYLFLLPIGYSVPITLGGSSLPAALVRDAIYTYVLDRSTSDTFTWSGYSWQKKDTGSCVWGPGPNSFSRDNVSVDSSDRLHLTVSYKNGQWRCPEIISTDSFGYGLYEFTASSVPTNLDGLITVGFFTYDDDSAEYHREIDIEYNNGAVVGSDAPWQYVVQPYTFSGQRQRFNFPTNSSASTHSFLWAPGISHFESFYAPPVRSNAVHATYSSEYKVVMDTYWVPSVEIPPFDLVIRPGESASHTNHDVTFYNYPSDFFRSRMSDVAIDATPQPFGSWSCIYGVPDPGQCKVHLNMWLFNGTAPADTNSVYEVVVDKFSFRPLDASALAPVLLITNVVQVPQGQKMDVIQTVPRR